MSNSVFEAERYNDRSLIESIVSSFYILDYGYIKTVHPDKTVDVVHAKRLKTYKGDSLNPTVSKSLEVLTIAGAGFSLQMDYKAGDKVLLLGLKDYVPNTKKVTTATETTSYMHYSRETLKALPLCVFNDEAKVQIVVQNGDLDVKTNGKIKLNGDSKQLVTWSELNTALTNFMTSLVTALTTTPIVGNGAPQPTWTGLPTQIDISGAKTTTVVTGG